MSRKISGRFTTVSSRCLHSGKIFDLKQVRMRASDGYEFQHDVLVHPGAVAIVPLISADRMILLRQYRPALKKIIWEFPAGTLEKGESPLACAKREIVEEIGYSAERWVKLGRFHPAPGVSTELMRLFLALKLSPKQAHLESDEFIESKEMTLPDVERLIRGGEIIDAKTLLGFFYFMAWRSGKRLKRLF